MSLESDFQKLSPEQQRHAIVGLLALASFVIGTAVGAISAYLLVAIL